VFEDGAHDGGARGTVLPHRPQFHNTSMTYFLARCDAASLITGPVGSALCCTASWS
jgi:hypothetical protein